MNNSQVAKSVPVSSIRMPSTQRTMGIQQKQKPRAKRQPSASKLFPANNLRVCLTPCHLISDRSCVGDIEQLAPATTALGPILRFRVEW